MWNGNYFMVVGWIIQGVILQRLLSNSPNRHMNCLLTINNEVGHASLCPTYIDFIDWGTKPNDLASSPHETKWNT
ncbi:hypothetical protein THII_1102 [Thioploca ingrica]|uniref:Uncharacterized protein n=1 Tax=Thioploca ingrica TaxID=40754 RepID=A0A090AEM9_9GAMM|nr:hypothetical protein THII_1102 [Thioploca ingrica]